MKQGYVMQRIVAGEVAMKVEIVCREVGWDCDFVAREESEEETLYSLLRHVQDEHTDDWFSIEETHVAARAVIHLKVA